MDNFTNPENNTQNTTGGTYSYDYMNNTTTTGDMNAAATSAPVYTAPQDTAPVYTAPQDTAPVYTAPQDTAPVYTAPQDTAPVYTAPQDTAPVYTAPQAGTFTGDTAAWQANNQTQQNTYETQNAYGSPYAGQYNSAANSYAAATPAPKKDKKGIALSIVALVLGILGLICCCLLGGWSMIISIPGVVCGIIALVKKCAGKGMAIAGVICSGLSIVLAIVMIILSAIGVSYLNDYMDDYSYSYDFDDYYDYY